jgi:hypothetical protein
MQRVGVALGPVENPSAMVLPIQQQNSDPMGTKYREPIPSSARNAHSAVVAGEHIC